LLSKKLKKDINLSDLIITKLYKQLVNYNRARKKKVISPIF